MASSKAKPKTLTLATTCGKTLKFLCKQEKDGDLRKDARMMEVNALLNRILQEDPEGRKRNLRLRTYSVTCLNEECGLLEWVENTSCKLCAVCCVRYSTVLYRMLYTPCRSLYTN